MSPEVVARKKEHLYTYLKDLRKFEHCSFEEFKKHHYEIERLLELIIEFASDITFHILSKKDDSVPSSYRMGFLRLGELNLISKNLASHLSNMVGMRNIIVHGYEVVDNEIIYQSIKQILQDIPQFLNEIESIEL